MADFEYGPVELYLVGFEGDRIDPGTIEALAELVDAGDIRLIDLLIVSRAENGDLEVTEVEDLGDEIDVTELSLEASGIVGEEDLAEFAESIPPGTSAAVLAVELVWAKKLASRFNQSGGVVLQTERIPAPVVNAVLAEAEGE
ncbi:hypothetical protein GE115_04425 [Agromyces sp. CFH 90414]|uniref:DUF1269 domain-containing protein n=1 Tax=Agromyces agglutinans TaxID=2662258 RepID=A0A6I2F9T5_9MICO|nr:DUF6325 family protein [Agromyces agglutinans]MRG59116.1 hypothetical protein [Agromyces agglutinans]